MTGSSVSVVFCGDMGEHEALTMQGLQEHPFTKYRTDVP